jgi:predicted nucleotide-binding protein
MEKSRIFIASSEKVHDLAGMIRDEIYNAEYCSADTWKDALQSAGAQSKIEALEQWVKLYDYAVIIFTKADALINGSGQDLKSRDDCVFEAGLFMATLGRQRCTLISFVEKSDLPSDLGGIVSLEYTEPEDLTNYEKCRHVVQAAAGAIKAWVQRTNAARSAANRPLTRDAILKRERMVNVGGVLREDQVVVASVQPPELEYAVARQVRMNMDNNIRYVYFFQGNQDAADKIPQLLQLILLADFLKEKDAGSFKTRTDLVTSHRDEIIELVKDACIYDKLNIFFLRDRVYPEYCLHNAASDKAARLYFKRADDYYIEWASGEEAYTFWRAVKYQNRVDKLDSPEAIFHGGCNFDLNEGGFITTLTRGMRIYFRDITEIVMGLCLSGPGAPASAVPPRA